MKESFGVIGILDICPKTALGTGYILTFEHVKEALGLCQIEFARERDGDDGRRLQHYLIPVLLVVYHAFIPSLPQQREKISIAYSDKSIASLFLLIQELAISGQPISSLFH